MTTQDDNAPDFLSQLDALDDASDEPSLPQNVPSAPAEDKSVGTSATAQELDREGFFAQINAEIAKQKQEELKRSADASQQSIYDQFKVTAGKVWDDVTNPENLKSARDAVIDPQQYAEGVKGVVPGAVNMGGSAIQAVGAVQTLAQIKAADFSRRMLDVLDRIEAGENIPLTKDPFDFQFMSPEQRLKARQDLLANLTITPVQERIAYHVGKSISDWSKGLLPAAPGYEQSAGRQIGEGLGSMVAGIPLAYIPGGAGVAAAATFYGLSGSGEGLQNALEFDAKERAAGRKGLTQEQIATAAVLGIGPGATDLLPIEIMLQKMKLPIPPTFTKYVGKYVAKYGGTMLVEGLQEGGQKFLQNVIAKEIYDENRNVFDGVPNDASVGGAVGFIAETGRSLLHRIARRGHSTSPHDAAPPQSDAAPEEAPQAPAPQDGGPFPPAPPAQAPSPIFAPQQPLPSLPSVAPDPVIAPEAQPAPAAPAPQQPAIPSLAAMAEQLLQQGVQSGVQPSAIPQEIIDFVIAANPELAQRFGLVPQQQEAQRQEPAAAPVSEATDAPAIDFGQEQEVVTPDGGMAVRVRPELVELGNLLFASGDLQPRDRTRQESEIGVQERAAGLDPLRLMPSRVTDQGAPIVGPDGTIISGNGRTMSIQRAYNDPALRARAEAYKRALGPLAAKMNMPVLIQRIAQALPQADLARLADLSNRPAVASMSAVERALRDARVAGAPIMGLYQGGSFLRPENREFFRAFMNQIVAAAERGAMSRDGTLTKEGEDRMAASILAAAYGDPDLLSRMLESTDDNIRGITQAMRDAAGAFIRLKEAIRAGEADAKFDITPQIAEAARRIADLRERGVRPAEFLAQQDAFNQVDPTVESLMRAFYNDDFSRQLGREKLTELLTAYANEAAKHKAEGLIPDETSVEDIVRFARERAVSRGPDASPDLFSPGSASVAGRPDAGPWQAAQRPQDDGRGRAVGPEGSDGAGAEAGSRQDVSAERPAAGGQQQGVADAALQAKFREVLAGTAPPRTWAAEMGIDKPTLDILIQWGVEQKLLRTNRDGKVFRAAAAKRTAEETAPAPVETVSKPRTSLSVPADARIDGAIRAYGKPVSETARNLAVRLADTQGTEEFASVMNEARKASKADALALAALVGTKPNSKTTKAQALASIEKRSQEMGRARARRRANGMVMAALRNEQEAVADGVLQKAEIDKLGYFSQALEAAKGLRQAKGTPEQMRAQLRSAGVKEAELVAVGLDGFLEGKKSVTKAELVGFIEQNRVGLREATYGTTQSWVVDPWQWGHNRGEPKIFADQAEAEAYAQSIGLTADHATPVTDKPAKWSSYSIDPSNPTYRETVIHLPGQSDEPRLAYAEATRKVTEAARAGDEPEMQRWMAERDRLEAEIGAARSAEFKSGHWSEPNVIAHARTSLQKTADGKTVFLIDELQSDWGQKLRDGGVRDEAKIAELRTRLDNLGGFDKAADDLGAFYDAMRAKYGDGAGAITSAEETAQGEKLKAVYEEARLLAAELRTAEAATPGHPLVNTTDQWTTTAFRRLIRQAVEAGADYIALTPGKVQNERFSLARHIKALEYRDNGDGTYYLSGDVGQGTRRGGHDFGNYKAEELPSVVGKELAAKILAGEGEVTGMYGEDKGKRTLSGLDLEVGGSGMKATYDSIYPRTLGKMLAKMDKDAGVMTDMPLTSSYRGNVFRNSDVSAIPFHTFPITDKVKESVTRQGLPLFSLRNRFAGGQREFTPQFSDAFIETVERVETYLQRMLPKGFSGVVKDRILGFENAADGITDIQMRLVEIVYDGDEARSRAIARHEVIHVLRQLNLINDEEFATLLARAKKLGLDKQVETTRYRKEYTRLLREYGWEGKELEDYLSELIDQEIVAKLAEQHVKGSRFGAKVDAILQAILERLQAIARAFKDGGFETIDSVLQPIVARNIMRSIESGETALRGEPAAEPAVPALEPGAAAEGLFAPDAPSFETWAASPVGQVAVEEAQRFGSPLFMFAGAKAKNADQSRLTAAIEMDAQGAAPRSVWQRTGWFKRADGWRFEIDDSKITFNMQDVKMPSRISKADADDLHAFMNMYGDDKDAVRQHIEDRIKELLDRKEELRRRGDDRADGDYFDKEADKYRRLLKPLDGIQARRGLKVGEDRWKKNAKAYSYRGPLGDLIDAPDLFAAYPQLGSVEVRIGDATSLTGSGSFSPTKRMISVVSSSDLDDIKSTLLHEIQHGIQIEEGFDAGGNDSTLAARTQVALFEVTQQIENLPFGSNMRGELERLREELRAQAEEFSGGISGWSSTHKGLESYSRLLGEVEARNVENRMKMDAAARAQSFPLDTEDMPAAEQYRAGDLVRMQPKNRALIQSAVQKEWQAANMPADGFLRRMDYYGPRAVPTYDGVSLNPAYQGDNNPTKIAGRRGNVSGILHFTPQEVAEAIESYGAQALLDHLREHVAYAENGPMYKDQKTGKLVRTEPGPVTPLSETSSLMQVTRLVERVVAKHPEVARKPGYVVSALDTDGLIETYQGRTYTKAEHDAMTERVRDAIAQLEGTQIEVPKYDGKANQIGTETDVIDADAVASIQYDFDAQGIGHLHGIDGTYPQAFAELYKRNKALIDEYRFAGEYLAYAARRENVGLSASMNLLGRQDVEGAAENQEQPGIRYPSLRSEQTQTTAFTLPGFDGEMEASVSSTGNAIHAYRTTKDGKPAASLILSQLPTGAWEASSYVIAEGADPTLLAQMIDLATMQLGRPLSPTGALSPNQYALNLQVNPAAVMGHVPVGEAAPGVMAPPQIIERMDAIKAQQKAAEATAAPSPRRTLSIPGLKEKMAEKAEHERARVKLFGPFAAQPQTAAWLGLPNAEFSADVKYISNKRSAKDADERLATPEQVRAHIEDVLANASYAYRYLHEGKQETWNLVKPAADGDRVVAVRLQSLDGRLQIPTAFIAERSTTISRLGRSIEQNGPEALKWKKDRASRHEVLRHIAQVPTESRGPSWHEVRRLLREDQEGMTLFSLRTRTPSNPNIKSLDDIIKGLKTSLGMPVTQGLSTLRVTDQANRRSWFFRPKGNVRATYETPAGIARLRTSTDIQAIAHEGGHHIERILRDKLDPLKQQHATELAAYGGSQRSGANALSEGFAEWFRTYITDPNTAKQQAPKFHDAFEEMMDGARPDILEQIDKVQLVVLSKAYQDYMRATTLERAMANLASNAPQGFFRRVGNRLRYVSDQASEVGYRKAVQQAFTEEIGQDGTISGMASQLYDHAIDDMHPFYLFVKRFLETADRNKVTDADGRAISLAVHENPYKLLRSVGDAYKTGLRWIQDGMPSYRHAEGFRVEMPDGRVVKVTQDAAEAQAAQLATPGSIITPISANARSASLHDALTKVFSGGKWNEADLDRFNAYLVARRAVEEWKTWEAKQAEMARHNKVVTDGAELLRAARKATNSIKAMAERRTLALAGDNGALKELYRQLEALRRLEEAQGQLLPDPDLPRQIKALEDRWKAVGARYAARDAQAGQLNQQIEKAEATLVMVDRDIELSRKKLRDLRENGIQRQPTAESREDHEKNIADLESGNPNFPQAAGMVYDFLWKSALHDYDAGRISLATLNYYATRKHYYVPFDRSMPEANDGGLFGRIGAGVRRFVKFQKDQAFTGSSRAIIKPIESIIEKAFNRAAATHFNDAMKAVAALADRVGPGAAAIGERVVKASEVEANEAAFQALEQNLMALGFTEQEAKDKVADIQADFGDNQLLLQWDTTATGPKEARPLNITFWENGERKYFRLNDPEIAHGVFNSINSIGRELSGTFIRMLQAPASLLRFTVTAHGAFIGFNLARDALSAFNLIGSVTNPLTWPGVTQVRGLYHEIAQSDLARMYQETAGIMGGQNVAALPEVLNKHDVLALEERGMHVSLSRTAMAAAAGAVLGGAIGGIPGAAMGATFGAAMHRGVRPGTVKETLAHFADMSETATRLGVFAHAYGEAIKNNPDLTPFQAAQEASFVARDLMDYGRRGSRMLIAAKLITFLNANIQGVDKWQRALLARSDRGNQVSVPKLVSLMASGALAGSLVAGPAGGAVGAAAAAAGGVNVAARVASVRALLSPMFKSMYGLEMSQDDQRALGASARVWTNWMLMTLGFVALQALYMRGGDDDDKARDEYLMVKEKVKYKGQPFKMFGEWHVFPKPFEWAIPSNIIEAGLEASIYGDPRFWQRVGDGLWDVLAPPGLPQAYRMHSDVRSNYNSFTQRPIEPDYMRKLDPELRFTPYSSELAIWLARSINESPAAKAATNKVGGLMFGKDKFEVSPLLIDYAIGQSLGFYGKDAQKVSNVAFAASRGEAPRTDKLRELPLIGTMVQRFQLDPYRVSDARDAFYDLAGGEAGKYTRAASSYDERVKAHGVKAANEYLATLPEDQRAYALLMATARKRDRDMVSPIERMKNVNSVVSGLQKEVLTHTLRDTTAKNSPEKITLSPTQAGQIIDLLEQVRTIEFSNTLHGIKHEQFAGRREIPITGVFDLIKSINPQVHEEIQRRYDTARVQDLKETLSAWAERKPEILKEWQEAVDEQAVLRRRQRTPKIVPDAPRGTIGNQWPW